MDFSQYQINQIWSLVSTPQGIAIVLILLSLLMMAVTIKGSRWLIVALLMYASTLGAPEAGSVGTFIPPIEQMRDYGRSICMVLLAMLLLPSIMSGSGWRGRLLLWPTWLFFVYELVASGRTMLGGRQEDVFRGYFGLVTYVFIFLTLGWGLSRWLQDFADARRAILCMVWTGILFAIGSTAQFVVHAGQELHGNRFMGTSDNPNHAATVLATILLPMIYMIVHGRLGPTRRMALIIMTSVTVVMLAWTGSRTGAVLALSGVAVLFRRNLKGFMLVAIGCGIFVLMAWQFFAPDPEASQHLLSMANTRGESWTIMWNEFVQSPLIGAPPTEAAVSESSYLMTAARIGLVGLVPFLLAIMLTCAGIMRLRYLRSQLGKEAPLADLVMAGMVGLMVGAMFEGYFYGIYSVPVFGWYIYLSLMAFLFDVAARGSAEQALPPDFDVEMADAQY